MNPLTCLFSFFTGKIQEEEEEETRVHPAQKGIVLYGRRAALYKPVHAKAQTRLYYSVPRKSLLASRVNFTSRALSKFSFRAADKFCRGGSQIFPQLRGREDTNPVLGRMHDHPGQSGLTSILFISWLESWRANR